MPQRRLFIVLILIAAALSSAGVIIHTVELYEARGSMSTAAMVSIILGVLSIVLLGGAAIAVALKKE
jgi:hypothetical protein